MKAFLSYSHRDERALDRLRVHLAQLKREGRLSDWYDREIPAGGVIDSEIDHRLSESELFIALVSPDFIASDYCHDVEMATALQRHKEGTLHFVPVILSQCDWRSTPMGKLKALPRDGLPIEEWHNQESAYFDVAQELRALVTQGSEFEQQAPSDSHESAIAVKSSRYRVKKSFDDVDKANYRDAAYKIMNEYFQSAIKELGEIEGVKTHFEHTEDSYSCIIVNNLDRGTSSHLHVRKGSRFFDDISYSFQERADPNTSNGGFSIENDEYDLFLKPGMQSIHGASEILTPLSAAEELWSDYLIHAGIRYD